ncbi:MAG: hypothetical protein WC386_03135 [Candidatus Paceibacterota bacterium]
MAQQQPKLVDKIEALAFRILIIAIMLGIAGWIIVATLNGLKEVFGNLWMGIIIGFVIGLAMMYFYIIKIRNITWNIP